MKTLLVNLLLVIFFFGLVEIILGLTTNIQLPGTEQSLILPNKFGSTHGLNPSSNGFSNGVNKLVNESGFWKYSKFKSKSGSLSLLLLGDSATMGIGAENDSTFAGIINNKSDSVHIYNPSLIAYTSEDYVNVAKYLIEKTQNKFAFEELTICWCLNDIYPNHPVKGVPGYSEGNIIFSELVSLLRNNLKLYHYLKKNFSDRPKEYFQFDNQFYFEGSARLSHALVNLDSIKTICDKYSVKLKIAFLPYEYQLRNFDQNDIWNPQSILKRKLAECNIEIIDCKNAFIEFTGVTEDLFLYGDGIHFSNTGHKLLAKYLSKQITSNVFLR